MIDFVDFNVPVTSSSSNFFKIFQILVLMSRANQNFEGQIQRHNLVIARKIEGSVWLFTLQSLTLQPLGGPNEL